MNRDFLAVRRSLIELNRCLDRLVLVLTVAVQKGGHAEQPRRRPRLSRKARASLVLQGRYIGFMRQLKPRQKAQVRKVKEAKGVRAAIARAQTLSRS